ncbi:site-specific integrase [Phenylobacterium sp.]|uniref:tyrosine-type recombinase/integrase n=1 Tax=Phenylobacterium sp. TaxID=1871053 RepID=UPI00286DA10A|nr:site-specific integrase [Phenylobacterium sp.]
MAVVRLKGLNSKSRILADGSRVTYWWAWKGGPRLPGKPGEPEFMAAYNDAVAARKAKPDEQNLASLVRRYRASPEFNKNADTTKAEWRRWLDRIEADAADLDIGGLPLKALDDRRVRADLLAWRDQWADRPRSADYAVQVLSRVLAFGMDRGLLALNAAAGVGQLYESDRADQIWTAEELAAYAKAAVTPQHRHIVALACLTGFRRSDLTRLCWSHISDVAIVMPTGKSRGRKTQVIPLLKETRELLADIRADQLARHAALHAKPRKARRPDEYRPAPPEPTTVLTNTRGLPWTASGLEGAVIDTKTLAGVDKHLHDARGTFGTRLRKAGLSASEIADVIGWDEERVERLLAAYVDRDAIVRDLAERIRKRESEG